MVIAFLTTRVEQTNPNDCNKLAHCVRYIRAAMDIPLDLEKSKVSVMIWWIKKSYGLHPDTKRHSGKTISLG